MVTEALPTDAELVAAFIAARKAWLATREPDGWTAKKLSPRKMAAAEKEIARTRDVCLAMLDRRIGFVPGARG